MKNKIRFIAVLLIAFALTLVGCGNNGGTTEETVTITTLQEKITLNVDEVLDYDYTALFNITSGTSNIEVKNEYLDLSNLSAQKGTYFVLSDFQAQLFLFWFLLPEHPYTYLVFLRLHCYLRV